MGPAPGCEPFEAEELAVDETLLEE